VSAQDPFAKYGGKAIDDDPFAKYGGSAIDVKPATAAPAAQVAPPTPYSLAGFGSNVLSSAGNLASNVASTLVHPLDTIESLAQLGLGAGAKVAGPQSYFGRELESRRAEIGKSGTNPVDDVMAALKQRYGGIQNIKKTAYEDPVGMMADIAAVLSGAGGAVKGAGELAGMSKLARAGELTGTVGGAVDPMRYMTKLATVAAKPVLSGAGKLTANALGLSTGAGAEPIKRAFLKPSPEFFKAMRGEKSIDDIVNDARDAATQLRNKASADYRSKLSTLPVKDLDVQPLAQSVRNELQNFGVNMRAHPRRGGGYTLVPDFSPQGSPNLTLGTAQGEVRRVLNSILDSPVKSNQGAMTLRDMMSSSTPIQAQMSSDVMDALHKRLSGMYNDTSEAKAFTSRIHDATRSMLNQIPGYQEMASTYHDAQDFLRKLDQEINTKVTTNPGTTARKLNLALNQNNEYRQNLLNALDKKAATDITDAIAGHALHQVDPRGLMRAGIGVETLLMIGHALSGSVPFSMAEVAALPFASPRAVGEVAAAAGKAVQKGSAARGFARATLRPEVYRTLTTATAPPPAPPPQ
jgi:hypothetical protein